ncbi:MAG: MFS transporter [Phreatobacter sp.]
MQTFAALSLAYIISIFFRSFLSVLATRIMADMQIGATELAAMSSAWFVAFALMQFPVGWALDHFGPRRTVLPLMLVGGIGVALFPFAPNATVGSLAMALIGIGCSPIYMGAIYVFARNHPAAQFGFLASLLIGVGSIGNLAGTTPLAWLADGFGWRQTMMMLAGLYCAAFALVAVFLRDPPRIAGKADSGLLSGLGAIVSTRLFWLLVPIVFVSYAIMVTLRGLWIAPYLAEVIGLTHVQQSNVAMLMALAMTASAFLFGWIESRWGQAKTLVVAGNLAVAAALAFLAVSAVQTPALATALFVAIGFCGFSYTILMAHARPFFPDHLVGRGMTLLNFVFVAGVAAVQTGSGWLIDLGRNQGLDAALTFARMHGALAAVLFISILVYMLAPRRPVAER